MYIILLPYLDYNTAHQGGLFVYSDSVDEREADQIGARQMPVFESAIIMQRSANLVCHHQQKVLSPRQNGEHEKLQIIRPLLTSRV